MIDADGEPCCRASRLFVVRVSNASDFCIAEAIIFLLVEISFDERLRVSYVLFSSWALLLCFTVDKAWDFSPKNPPLIISRISYTRTADGPNILVERVLNRIIRKKRNAGQLSFLNIIPQLPVQPIKWVYLACCKVG